VTFVVFVSPSERLAARWSLAALARDRILLS
jgi:hypothetical protein